MVTHINHKAIEKMARNLMFLRQAQVLNTEKSIMFGGASRSWKDVEVDEATFDKRTLAPCELSTSDKKAGRNAVWEHWGGLVQRRCPQTLALVKLNLAISVPRAPGPGATRKVDWQPMAEKWLQDRRVILHSDSAKSYHLKVAGVLHDAMVHQKTRHEGRQVCVEEPHLRQDVHPPFA